MDFFEKIKRAPPDPIFGVRTAFELDRRSTKINLGIGIYKTSDLKSFVLTAVRKAESKLLHMELDKDYLPINGDPKFLNETRKLIFDKIADPDFVASAQTIGGTGALKLGGEFLYHHVTQNLSLSDPTWDNHHRIFSQIGFAVSYHPYYDKKKRMFNFEKMRDAIYQLPEKSILFLQGCCHNPTGFDPTIEEWKKLADVVKEKKLLPFFDFAYQGFGNGLAEDAEAIRYFAQEKIPLVVASSYAKNFGLYAERVGALFILTSSKDEKERVDSQLKLIIRGIYSNPPCHGVRIVNVILQDPELNQLWQQELASMRLRIQEMRNAMYAALQSLGHGERFAFLTKQTGMFSYTCLDLDQVEKLTAEYGIYLLKDGRINVSGLNTENLSYVAEAIDAVCS